MSRGLVCLVFACILSVPVLFAQTDIYNNGPTNGTVDGWTINFGFVVSDSFTLFRDEQAVGFSFAAWLFPGDVLESAELSITSEEFGGTTYFDGPVNFSQSDCATNPFGFSVCTESASFARRARRYLPTARPLRVSSREISSRVRVFGP